MKKISFLLIVLALLSGCTLNGAFVEEGDTVSVDYIGRLDDGRIFDTTLREVAESAVMTKTETFTQRRVYTPFKFTIGAGEVIEGFDEGVIGLKEGASKEVVIPPSKGYGEKREDFMELYPRIQRVDVIETVPIDELSQITGVTQFFKNNTIPWRYWNARIMIITASDVVLKNEVSDTKVNTEVGPLEIKVETGTITMTLSPVEGTTIDTDFGPARISFLNSTNFIVDYNHPLAGETLTFEITVNSIEKAGQ